MSQLDVVIATCYGASNTGQLAGAAATELARENEGYALVCLPAVAIDQATGLDKVKNARLLVVVEGCPVMCCTKILEAHTGSQPDIRVEMVQDYGVKKAPVLSYDELEKERIKKDIKRRIVQEQTGCEAMTVGENRGG
jgi:uncharacterized metal-binding protein